MGGLGHNGPMVRSAARRAAPRGKRWILVAVLVGCLSVVGWVGYQYWFSNVLASAATADGVAELRDAWAEADGEPVQIQDGSPFALLSLPTVTGDAAIPIISGTSNLSRGVGWYDSTAEPGALGNFAVAGHRITNGAPFADLLQLEVGDEVVVETQSHVYTYKVVVAPRDLTVSSTDDWVLDPVPGQPDQVPWEATLTMTTAQDLMWSQDRSVGFAVLDSEQEK